MIIVIVVSRKYLPGGLHNLFQR